MSGLEAAATALKTAAAQDRKDMLRRRLTEMAQTLPPVFRLPLSPAMEVTGFVMESCGFFASKSLPLRLTFSNAQSHGTAVRVMYKTGDDLRQDALVIQLASLMNQLWVRAGLNLHMVTYAITPTSPTSGFVELRDAYTLREIQTRYGVTGSFNNRILNEWLQHANPSPEEFAAARANFTASCAGYCVLTYVLGRCRAIFVRPSCWH